MLENSASNLTQKKIHKRAANEDVRGPFFVLIIASRGGCGKLCQGLNERADTGITLASAADKTI
jgi:hypothetical protein